MVIQRSVELLPAARLSNDRAVLASSQSDQIPNIPIWIAGVPAYVNEALTLWTLSVPTRVTTGLNC